MRQAISADIRRLVMLRADQRCEYCRLHQNDSFLTFTLDHIASLKHGGGNEIGQATVKLLRLNDPDRLIIRQLLTRAGRYP